MRILGKGNVQKQAIAEIEALPVSHPFRTNALAMLSMLRANLLVNPNKDPEDQELAMRLSPIYDQQLAQAKQEGLQQGLQEAQRSITENLLVSRFGSLDEELATIIDPLIALPPAEFTRLLLQLSREELLSMFAKQN